MFYTTEQTEAANTGSSLLLKLDLSLNSDLLSSSYGVLDRHSYTK